MANRERRKNVKKDKPSISIQIEGSARLPEDERGPGWVGMTASQNDWPLWLRGFTILYGWPMRGHEKGHGGGEG